MLFNSYIFMFTFLPTVLLLFFYFAKYNHRNALITLCLASLFFYSWNNSQYLPLLLFSITINFLISKAIINTKQKKFLWLGIIFNLGLLSYFKYTNFFIQNINQTFHQHLSPQNIILPLGISFFTFTQIAFLVDCYRGLVQKYKFLNYVLFVSYFPHLIAGPIIHHKEVMPQFDKPRTFKFNHRNFLLGLTLFTIGLFKKTLLADSLGTFVGPVFDVNLVYISAIDAWVSALTYSLELYFDFSGYSDMAIGLSLLFGVKLPVNFYSPYLAVNIIEFWRRWNMTLSRFLRDYLYIPLGGNRKGSFRRYLNLMITMLLGGLWHGANWNFVLWGCLHGVYLSLNHGWIYLRTTLGFKPDNDTRGTCILSRLATFIMVVIAWVFFRAPSVAKGNQILHSMFLEQFTFPTQTKPILFIIVSLIIVWTMPNSYQLLRRYRPALLSLDHYPNQLVWKPTFAWSFCIAFMLAISIINLQTSSIFLYYKF